MAIISAGVIMNIFLGLACFVYAYGQGMDAIPAKVGAVIAGLARLQGRHAPRRRDRRRSTAGSDIKFTTLMLKVSLSRHGQVLRFGVRRPGRDGVIEMDIQPVREAKSERPTIGIVPADSLTIAGFLPPAGMANPPDVSRARRSGPCRRTSSIPWRRPGPPIGADVPLASHDEYMRLLAGHPKAAIKHIIERRSASSGEDGPVKERLELTLPRRSSSISACG